MNQKTQTTHTTHTIAIIFVLIAATLLPATAQTTIRRVTTSGAATGTDGSDFTDQAMSLQAALMASTTPGDQVWIAQGTYTPHASTLRATFTIRAGVLVYGGFEGTEDALADRVGAATILSGDLMGNDSGTTNRSENSFTVVTVDGDNVTLDRLTIQGGAQGTEESGTSDFFGGGLYSKSFNTKVNACIFTNNMANNGGGGAYFKQEATVTNCVFASNTIANRSDGGGLYLVDAGSVINSTFYSNEAPDGMGGGLFVSFNTGAGFNLQNNILIGNTALSSGPQAYIDNSVIMNSINLQNNIIERGVPRMDGDPNSGLAYGTNIRVTEEVTVPRSDASNIFASTISSDADYLWLKDGSPAINRGNSTYVNNASPRIMTDITGAPRIQGSTVDLGAYEKQPNPTIALSGTDIMGTSAGYTVTVKATGGTFDVLADIGGNSRKWTVTETTDNDDIITLPNPATVTGDGTAQITITTNTDEANTRTATLTFTTDGTPEATTTLTITQQPAPSTFRVKPTGTGDGSSWENAMTLQMALAMATTAGDQIWIAQGTYKPHANNRRATFTIPAGMLVYGGFAGTEAALADRAGTATILSGDLMGDDSGTTNRSDNSFTVVTITGADVTLDGLTIAAGEERSRGDGAGLYAESGATGTVLRNCLFMDNVAALFGGGAYLRAGATLTNCTFIDNEANVGGGAYFSGDATLTGCTFTGNMAEDEGGGAYFNNGTLINCVFAGNIATIEGGGAYLRGTNTVINATFYNNTATDQGGGLFTELNDQQLNLQNSILIGNTAQNAASGHQIYVLNGNTVNVVNLQHNLLAGGATGGGAGIRMVNLNGGSANVTEAGTVAESDASAGVCKHGRHEYELLAPKGVFAGGGCGQ